MTLALYILIIFFPFVFLIRKGRKEVFYAACLVGFFLMIHGRFLSGARTVTWDTLAWSLGMQHVKNLLHGGSFIGWNPLHNSGEPLYIYHYAYAYWQWFAFILLDWLIPVTSIQLFNIFLLFLYIFYNIGCYLVFLKVFKDFRVALFCLAVSIFSLNFDVYLVEHSSLYISIYFPYIIYFFLEFVERRSSIGLALIPVLFGVAANAYVPHFIVLAVLVFAVSYFVFMDKGNYSIKLDRSALLSALLGSAMALVLVLPVIYVFFRMSEFVSPVRTGVDSYMDMDIAKTGHHQEFKAMLQIFAVSSYTRGRMLLYIGIAPLVLAGIGVFKSTNRFRWTVLAAAVGLFFISVGRNSFPYLLMHYLPTFSFMRHYIIFEIFVQFMMILLAGMGLEYILAVLEEKRIEGYIMAAIGFSAVAAVHAVMKFKEMREGLAPLIHMTMFVTMLALAAAAVAILIQTRSRKAYIFLMTVVILNAGSLQWYFSDLHFDLIQESKDANEPARLAEILDKDHAIKWNPMRHGAYSQQIKVANYNTFESVLDNFEESYWEPVERNLLVNKRYYTLADMRNETPDYFGINHTKLFLTDDFMVLPQAGIKQAMSDGWYDFLTKRRVYFAREDFYRTDDDEGSMAYAKSADSPDDGSMRLPASTAQSMNDEFNTEHGVVKGEGVSMLGDWFVKNVSYADFIDINISNKGMLTIDAGEMSSHNWANNLTAPYVYKEFAGDFEVETAVSSNHRSDNEFAGLLVRYPGITTVDKENWIAIESGSSGNREVFYIINTVDGVSSVATPSPADDYLRVVRSKEMILLYSRHAPADPWTLRAHFSRPDFGDVIQAGMTAQPDNANNTFVARFDWFRSKVYGQDALLQNAESIAIDKYTENKLSLTVDSARPSFLVYLQNYDKDWSAYVNGVKTPIVRVNYAFQAVRVPKGRSMVVFRYSSRYKYLLALHLITAFVSVGMMITAFGRRRPDEESYPDDRPGWDDVKEVDK